MKKEIILNNVKELVSSFLYYNRKEDEDLQLGEIENLIELKEISINDIVNIFEKELRKNFENWQSFHKSIDYYIFMWNFQTIRNVLFLFNII